MKVSYAKNGPMHLKRIVPEFLTMRLRLENTVTRVGLNNLNAQLG